MVEDIAVISDLVWMRAYVSRLHLLYMYIVKKSESESRSFVSDSLDPIDCSLPGSSLGKNTGVGCHSLPQGIIRTQGSNLHFLYWQVDSLPLSHQGKVKVKVTQSCPNLCNPMDCIVHGILQARILEWVAFPFSRGSSQPRDRTQVSHSAGRFFTS